MAQAELFHTPKTKDITEAEYQKIKRQLFSLRRQYIQKIWGSKTGLDIAKLQPLEGKIASLENRLAHTHVIR